MAALRQAMSDTGRKAPGKPLYLRQISQILRAAGQDFDSRRHGFRAILDLLHQAQREGQLRLHRDHRGTWRVFPLAGPAAAEAVPAAGPALASAPGPEEVTEPGPAEVDVRWEEALPIEEIPDEPVEMVEAVAAPSTEAAPVEEATPGRRTRKSRAPRGAKSGTRKSSSRRKAKETSPE